MTKNTLSPSVVSELAQAVYAVNSGDPKALTAFLTRPVFGTDRTSKSLLNADVGGRVVRAAKDSFGLAALGAGLTKNHLFLIFRGTTSANNKADFISDARIGLTSSTSGWPVHIGFNQTFRSMIPEIREFCAANPSISTVHCIGHSLGGAVATLAADWAYSHIAKDVKLYTFGQPRVGLSGHALNITRKLTKANVHRVYHTTDPVPMVPIFPYVHNPLPGKGHRIESDELIHTAAAHSMSKYVGNVKGKRWDEIERAYPNKNLDTAIRDWLNSRRNENPNCPKTFEWVERALIWIISKFLSGVISVVQMGIIGVHTLIDKLAWLLAKSIEIKDTASKYIRLFIQKIARVLGIPLKQTGSSFTQSFLRYILQALMRRAYDLAQRAIRHL